MIGEISPKEFKEVLYAHNIVDCVVRDRNSFYFIAREDYTGWPKSKWDPERSPPPEDVDLSQHVVVHFRDEPLQQRWTHTALKGLGQLINGVAYKPLAKQVAVSMQGSVYSVGSGSQGMEKSIASWREKGPKRGAVSKLRTIDGWLYFCGGNNSVGKRLDAGEWFSHTQAVPDPDRQDHLHNRFEDIDGYSESDIYTVGSDGQVFRFDGKAWIRLAFPTNAELETVCCAGDGKVYISDVKGSVYKGRGEEWKQIHKGSLSLPWRDMVWYDGRLWCTSDYGVWTISGDKVEKAALPPGIAVNAGNLSTADGVLLLAGYGGVAFLEDGKWTTLYNAAEMHDLVRQQQREGGAG